MRKTLYSIGLGSLIGLAGCGGEDTSTKYIEGRVLKEFGSAAGLGSLGSGEITYGIEVKTLEGDYTIEFNDLAGSRGPHTLLNLAIAIEEGTRIRFPYENVYHDPGEDRYAGFSEDKLGVLDPDDVQVLDNQNIY